VAFGATEDVRWWWVDLAPAEGLLLVQVCAAGAVGPAAAGSQEAWLERREYVRRFGGR
jgi:hypothetical protein